MTSTDRLVSIHADESFPTRVQAAINALIAAGIISKADAATVNTALAAKAPLASPAFTGTPTGITKTHVGLSNVDNTSDANKPVSTAQAAAISAAINALIAGAPGALDTLNEIAAQLATDESVASSLTTVVAGKLAKASNLSDLSDAPTARTNLGLGTAATKGTGTSSGTVAAGDDSRIVKAVQNDAPETLFTAADGVAQSGIWNSPRGARALPAPSKVISRFPSAHGWTGGTDDTTTFLYGDRSYKGTSAGTGALTYLTSPTLTAVDCSASMFRLIFQVDVATRLNNVSIVATSTAGNAYQGNVQVTPFDGEWCIATINRSQFTIAAGAPSWSSITKFDIRYKDNGGGNAVTIRAAALELLPDLAATYPSGVFVLEADDGYAGQFANLLPITSARGIPVTFNVIGDRFVGGSPASGKTVADLRALQNQQGWNIACHAYSTSVHNGPATTAQLEADFLRQKQWLRANGLNYGFDDYAMCPGTGSPVPEGAVMETLRRNFRSARVNSGFFETVVPADPHKLRSVLFSGNTNANLQSNIDSAAGAGGVLIFTVHDVLTGATNGTSNSLPAIAATNLATVLDYAATKGMVFRTRADLMERR